MSVNVDLSEALQSIEGACAQDRWAVGKWCHLSTTTTQKFFILHPSGVVSWSAKDSKDTEMNEQEQRLKAAKVAL